MKGIEENNESLISFNLNGLIIGTSTIVAMHLELLIASENHLYRDLQSTVRQKSKWSILFRESLGIDQDSTLIIMKRGKSALKLFLETLEIITTDDEVTNFVRTSIRMISAILSK